MRKILMVLPASVAMLVLPIPSEAEPLPPAPSSATSEMPKCPIPGEKCKVILLTESEENALMKPNGILDTAAQARNLDLGGVAVYFKTKIGSAPEGQVVPKPSEKPAEPAK